MADLEPVTGDVSDDLGQEYYKKEELVDSPIVLTIKSVARRLFPARDGSPEVKKLELTFTEPGSKKLVLNKTNLKIVVKAYGKVASAWIGQRIQLYFDENVTFAGNLLGGLRIHTVKLRARPVAVAPPAGDEIEMVDGERVPF